MDKNNSLNTLCINGMIPDNIIKRIIKVMNSYNTTNDTECVHENDDVIIRWASYKGYVQIVEILIEYGANIHAKDDEALRHACYCGHSNVVECLLKNGADVHVLNNNPIRYASQYGYFDIVEILIKYGAIRKCDNHLIDSSDRDHSSVMVKLEKYINTQIYFYLSTYFTHYKILIIVFEPML
jgi:ankyrin repeat protein